MRLRSLRKLEELELRTEHDKLTAERGALMALLGSQDQQWVRITQEIRDIKKRFGQAAPGGARRSGFSDAPRLEAVPIEAMLDKEPVTVMCSEKGWIRAMRGHIADDVEIKYKDGDRARFRIHAQTTDKILLFATGGRFFTIGCDRLPGGRGNGDPVRLIVDLPNDQDIVALFVHRPGRRLLVASSAGNGFVVPEDDVVAQTKSGRQVLNVAKGAEAQTVVKADGDQVAVIGENRKILIFPLTELPEMGRGKGVRLQRYKDGGLADIQVFSLVGGLTWTDSAGRLHTHESLAEWQGNRAAAGRLAPRGFPKNNRFGMNSL